MAYSHMYANVNALPLSCKKQQLKYMRNVNQTLPLCTKTACNVYKGVGSVFFDSPSRNSSKFNCSGKAYLNSKN